MRVSSVKGIRYFQKKLATLCNIFFNKAAKIYISSRGHTKTGEVPSKKKNTI